MNPNKDTLLEDLKNINPLTDVKTFQRLRQKVLLRNINDERNSEVFEVARQKWVIL